jgi:hypothetical protein
MRIGVARVEANRLPVSSLRLRVPLHLPEDDPEAVMRVGVARVEANRLPVGGLGVRVAALVIEAIPCCDTLFGLGGGLGLARGGLSLADDIGECVKDGLRAGALRRVLGQQRLNQLAQRAGVPRRVPMVATRRQASRPCSLTSAPRDGPVTNSITIHGAPSCSTTS